MKHILLGLIAATASLASANPVTTLRTIEALIVPQKATSAGSCSAQQVRSPCTNSSDTFTFNGCSVADGKVTLFGSFDELFAGTSADQCTLPLVNGESVTQTSKGLTLQFESMDSLLIDTAAATAYDGTMIPATGIVSSQANDATSITINGAHALYKNPQGQVSRELLVMSTAPVVVSGKHQDATLVVSQGAVRAFDQIDKYTSDITVENVAWSVKNCCHPAAGKITEVMTGSKTGTRTLTFGPECGSAQLTDVDGSVKDIVLPACQ